jgi:hypothetical protein
MLCSALSFAQNTNDTPTKEDAVEFINMIANKYWSSYPICTCIDFKASLDGCYLIFKYKCGDSDGRCRVTSV